MHVVTNHLSIYVVACKRGGRKGKERKGEVEAVNYLSVNMILLYDLTGM